ncbi:hypothetical protein DX980_00210 (plasmid) [Burkholderia gladioli]|uniref:hypothetical protein n=1 Tax=Burkholderia gladioli TaxID=28095 RepID=UPI001364AAB1|nr:hypothetical protein [Burkholderia gladioli]KAF1065541.1 hypothetical protein LvStA_00033 [Burkholderia gladioli]WAG17828.1 hypothetical protein DX980_00210 [Burkholderia gladioli]
MTNLNDNHNDKGKRFNEFLERASLGLVGVCVLIIVGMLTVPLPMDAKLSLAIRCAAVALPIFFAIYMAKDAAAKLVGIKHPKAAQGLRVVFYLGVVGLGLLGASIVCIVGHFSPGFALLVFFLLLASGELSRRLSKIEVD